MRIFGMLVQRGAGCRLARRSGSERQCSTEAINRRRGESRRRLIAELRYVNGPDTPVDPPKFNRLPAAMLFLLKKRTICPPFWVPLTWLTRLIRIEFAGERIAPIPSGLSIGLARQVKALVEHMIVKDHVLHQTPPTWPSSARFRFRDRLSPGVGSSGTQRLSCGVYAFEPIQNSNPNKSRCGHPMLDRHRMETIPCPTWKIHRRRLRVDRLLHPSASICNTA